MPDKEREALDRAQAADVGLDRDSYLRALVTELAGVLQDVVGPQEASGFISIVGQRVSEELSQKYQAAFETGTLSRLQLAAALVDLTRRVAGQFYIIEQSDSRIVFGNRACPFGDKVLGRPSMCMTTSNVFGAIAARNLGYAKVEIRNAIAEGDAECRVVVHLALGGASEDAPGREYFKTGA
jgi:hypothetical protein